MKINYEKLINDLGNSDLLTECDIYHMECENMQFDSSDELREYMQERINESDGIIYYWRAMEYLTENDKSLKESLTLAHDLGFTLDNLSSETLASLLYMESLRNELNELNLDKYIIESE